MHENAVEITDLTFRYTTAKEPTLKNVNLNFRRGEIALLIGPTGAGKSTLYMCLNGVIPHLVKGRLSGQIKVAGMDTSKHSISELSQKIGIVFQDPEIQLFSLSVHEELAFGPENLGVPVAEIERRVQETVNIVQLHELLEREPARLSGGQQQTVAIGSIWSMLPDVVILDEPTSNLDPQGSLQVLDLIKRLNTEHEKTILIAEHKIDEVAPFVDRVFVMNDGQVLMDGSPHEVFSQVDALHALGLMAPAATEMAHRLKRQGLVLDRYPITIEEGIALFSELLADAQRAPSLSQDVERM